MSSIKSASHVEMNCPTCAAQCEDAKAKVKSLEKRLYVMTIAVTASMTMLGKEAVQTLMTYVNTVKDISTDGSDANSKQEEAKKVSLAPTFSNKPWWLGESSRYRPVGSVAAGDKSEPTKEKQATNDNAVLSDNDVSAIVAAAMKDTKNSDRKPSIEESISDLPMESMPIEIANASQIAPYPFLVQDIQFGGYDVGQGFAYVSNNETTVPSPNTLFVLALTGMFNNRSRI